MTAPADHRAIGFSSESDRARHCRQCDLDCFKQVSAKVNQPICMTRHILTHNPHSSPFMGWGAGTCAACRTFA
jgi:hypothetical protein